MHGYFDSGCVRDALVFVALRSDLLRVHLRATGLCASGCTCLSCLVDVLSTIVEPRVNSSDWTVSRALRYLLTSGGCCVGPA